MAAALRYHPYKATKLFIVLYLVLFLSGCGSTAKSSVVSDTQTAVDPSAVQLQVRILQSDPEKGAPKVYLSDEKVLLVYGGRSIELPYTAEYAKTHLRDGAISALGENIVVVPYASGEILSSSDCGKSWSSFALQNTEGRDFWMAHTCIVSETVMYVAVEDERNELTVAKSLDGGKTWSVAAPTGEHDVYHLNVTSVEAYSESICMITRRYYTYNDLAPTVVVTLDGGKSWIIPEISLPDELIERKNTEGTLRYAEAVGTFKRNGDFFLSVDIHADPNSETVLFSSKDGVVWTYAGAE